MNVNSYKCCSRSSIESKQIESLVSILKLVAEPNRLKLLCLLKRGKHCVCQLMEHVSLSQSLISHHLKDLKTGGVVQSKKRGLFVDYFLTPEGKRITNLLFNIT